MEQHHIVCLRPTLRPVAMSLPAQLSSNSLNKWELCCSNAIVTHSYKNCSQEHVSQHYDLNFDQLCLTKRFSNLFDAGKQNYSFFIFQLTWAPVNRTQNLKTKQLVGPSFADGISIQLFCVRWEALKPSSLRTMKRRVRRANLIRRGVECK